MYTVTKETDEPFLHVSIPPTVDQETGEITDEGLDFNLIDGKSEPLDLTDAQIAFLKASDFAGQPVESLPEGGAAPEPEGGE